MAEQTGIRTLSVDFGGTRVKIAAVADGCVFARDMFDVSDGGVQQTLAQLADRAKGLMAAHPGSWAGIGFATPGIVDEDARRVVSINAKHAGIEQMDLADWAQRELGLDFKIVNDARAALLGELAYGMGQGERNAVLMILGTGVGTSAVCEGRVTRGGHGTHSLLGGHFPICFDGGRPCNCGGSGCLEAYVGTWALKEMAGDSTYDYRRLEADWRKGEPKAVELFRVISRALGAGALSLVHFFDAETVIFSGGASRFAALLEAAEAYVLQHAWTPWGKVKFVVSKDPEMSGTLGVHALFAKGDWR